MYFETTFHAVRGLANAWAQGHVEELRAGIPSVETDPCNSASTYFSEGRRIVDDLVREKWLAAAEAALANNRSTFAVLGLSDLLATTGVVAQLQSKGYVIEISAK
jgi:hypothetical protein